MQQKLSAAEAEAERMLLPGAHSTGPGEDGENLPVWVEIFRKYFEKKKSAVSKTARQEQFRTALRTMRNTLVPPANSLDYRDESHEEATEVTAPVNRLPAVNSLVATGGSLTLVPTTAGPAPIGNATIIPPSVSATNGRNVRQRVGSSFTNDCGGLGIMGSNMGSLPLIIDMMNKQNRVFMRRSFRDVHSDYQLAKSALATAKAENDDGSISFYQVACHKLEEELKSFE